MPGIARLKSISATIAVVVALGGASCATGSAETGNCTSIWSTSGHTPGRGGESGNGATVFFEDGVPVLRTSKGVELVLDDAPGAAPLIEVTWDDERKLLGLSGSDGGVVGTWDARIYAVGNEGVASTVDVGEIARQAKVLTPDCTEVEAPNVGLVGFRSVNSRSEALVLVEVPPHSSCKNLGALRGLVIDVDRQAVVSVLSESEVRRDWGGSLGCRVIHP